MSRPVVVPIEDALDLHAFAPREIPSVVESYLEAALEAGFHEVRLIHGRGRGVQRRRVHEVLSASPLVERFADAPPERGGYLGYYLAEGARAYARASALAEGEPRAGRVLYRELSVRFEYYAGALDYLRKVRFPGLAGPDPVGAFLREIEGVVAGLSRN